MGKKQITIEQATNLMFVKYPDLVNVNQFRVMLGGISKKSAYRLLHTGKIDFLTDGKGFKIPKISIIQYILNKN